MLKRNYKLFAFDLDGTLVDTRIDIGLALQAVLVSAGLEKASEAEIRSAIGGGARNAVHKLTGFEAERLDYYEQLFYEEYNENCSSNAIVYEGGIELLKQLKDSGKILAVITMKAKIPTLKILKDLGLYGFFDDIIAFEDTEKRKPDPESLFKLLEKHGLKPKDALMIGDTTTDIYYAKNAGVDVCAAKFGYGIAKDLLGLKPQYEIDSFIELKVQ